ncbi:membrane protease YdiL (CAAX protease family) [Caulobacter ginsengisoli]|uniref:Membrane protease YdiL (CAAX protease family) n=1 Tax=Caulobacter ginsengisoli TaxID=400775 RepID=A0ABU0IYD1_9CAUL|nr:CPBP family intramembrane glutamic endopeptidase [Caulobacter ginsengisoli]MDQ0466064.1 membrane protease YdiL (CAAX protease family) [Caulobacter ginsengisoli]
MSPFQLWALVGIALWLLAVVVRFRRSTPVLVGGLALAGLYALGGLWLGWTSLDGLGLTAPSIWIAGLTLAWLLLMLALSPLADRLASALIAAPPTLGAFKAIQQSRAKLAIGIAVAWLLGGFLEELVFRGLVLRAVEAGAAPWLVGPAANGLAIVVAALGAGVIHLYQGPRAALIIVQLSMLFGLLFVLSGYNLWSVIVCHGLYDTVAFIRFAMGKSKYSKPAD